MDILPEAIRYFFLSDGSFDSFYIERNDYKQAHLSLEQEIGEMLTRREITADVAAKIAHTRTVWSARQYDEYGDVKVVYAATMADAVNGLYKELHNA